MYILTTDRPATDRRQTTDISFRKISNGHISTTGRPSHFMFGSRVGFLGPADLMALFSVRKNPRSAAILEKFQMAISPQPVVRSTPCLVVRSTTCLVLGWVFSGTADLMVLFSVEKNQRWRSPPSLKNFKWPYHSGIDGKMATRPLMPLTFFVNGPKFTKFFSLNRRGVVVDNAVLALRYVDP